MKATIRNLLLLFLLIVSFSSGEGSMGDQTPSWDADDSIGWSGEDGELPIKGFFQVDLEYENIFRSCLDGAGETYRQLGYRELNTGVTYTRLFSKDDALGFGAGYTRLCFDWPNNPFFHDDPFPTFDISINGMTKLFDKIECKGGVSASIDTREWSLPHYTYYMFSGWGRYPLELGCLGEVGFNLGATLRRGLKDDLTYPILGFDFEATENIDVNLIFPIDMAITYHYNDSFSFQVLGRLLNSRRRFLEDDAISKGFIEYCNSGIEFGITYECGYFAMVNIHFGSTLGAGDVRIFDSGGEEIQRFEIDPAPYFGGEFFIRF